MLVYCYDFLDKNYDLECNSPLDSFIHMYFIFHVVVIFFFFLLTDKRSNITATSISPSNLYMWNVVCRRVMNDKFTYNSECGKLGFINDVEQNMPIE